MLNLNLNVYFNHKKYLKIQLNNLRATSKGRTLKLTLFTRLNRVWILFSEIQKNIDLHARLFLSIGGTKNRFQMKIYNKFKNHIPNTELYINMDIQRVQCHLFLTLFKKNVFYFLLSLLFVKFSL